MFDGQERFFPVNLNWDFSQFGVFLLDTKEVSILSSTGSKLIYRAVVSGQTGDNIEVLFYFGQ